MLLLRLLEAESSGSSLEMSSSSWPHSSRWVLELSWDLRCSRRSMGMDFLALITKKKQRAHFMASTKIQHNDVCMSGGNPSLLLIHMMLAVGTAAVSYPAGGDCVLKHAADCGSQSPWLPPQQTLHTALSRQQGEVRQTSVGMEAEELVAVNGNVHHVYETRKGKKKGGVKKNWFTKTKTRKKSMQ